MGAPNYCFPRHSSDLDGFLSEFKSRWRNFCSDNPEEIPSYTEIYHPQEGFLISAGNQSRSDQHSFFHSEWICIHELLSRRNSTYLENCLLITALEPCLHCSGSIIRARISEVIYFAKGTKAEGISRFPVETIYGLNHFPRLQYHPDSEIFSAFQGFFIDKR